MFDFEEFAKANPEIFKGKAQEEINELRKVIQPFSEFMEAWFGIGNKKNVEESKVQTIKNITIETGEECEIDVDMLHDALAKLPAEIYLKLYHKMQVKVLGYPGFYGGCGAISPEEEKAE